MKTKDTKKELVCTKYNSNMSMHKQHSNPPSVEYGSGFRKLRMVPIILFTSLRHLHLHILNLDSNTYIEKHHIANLMQLLCCSMQQSKGNISFTKP
jgi:hypothetical protein